MKFAHNKIKKSHLLVLELLAAQVARNKLIPDPFLSGVSDKSSQRSTDAAFDLTSISGEIFFLYICTWLKGKKKMIWTVLRKRTKVLTIKIMTNKLFSWTGKVFKKKKEGGKVLILVKKKELPLDDVRQQMQDPKEGVPVGDRSWRLKTYKNVVWWKRHFFVVSCSHRKKLM